MVESSHGRAQPCQKPGTGPRSVCAAWILQDVRELCESRDVLAMGRRANSASGFLAAAHPGLGGARD